MTPRWPAHASWLLWIADTCVRLQSFSRAADAYAAVLRADPAHRRARYMYAWCLLEVPARRGDGISAFQDLLKDSPSANGSYQLARALQQEARHAEAIAAFDDAFRLQDGDTASFVRHQYAESLEAVQRFDDAAEAYRGAAQLDPSDADAWTDLARVLTAIGSLKDAVPCQQRAMRLAPTSTRALTLACLLHELKRLDEAEHAAGDAVALDPRSVDARVLLAQILAAQERIDDALAVADDVWPETAEDPESRALLSGVWLAAGRHDEARQIAQAAAVAAPESSRVHARLAAIHLELGDGRAALATLARMAECLPGTPDGHTRLQRLHYLAARGAALGLLGEHAQADVIVADVRSVDAEFYERWPELLEQARTGAVEARSRPTT